MIRSKLMVLFLWLGKSYQEVVNAILKRYTPPKTNRKTVLVSRLDGKGVALDDLQDAGFVVLGTDDHVVFEFGKYE